MTPITFVSHLLLSCGQHDLLAVLEHVDKSSSGERSMWHLRVQPGERDLPWGAIVPRRHRLDFLDEL